MDAIKVAWYDAGKTIILREQGKPIEWNAVHAARREAQHMLDQVDHTVDFIVRIEHQSVPKNAIPNIRKVVACRHPNKGVIIVVNLSSFMQQLFAIVGRLERQTTLDWYFADTIKEAESLLAKLRQRRTECGDD